MSLLEMGDSSHAVVPPAHLPVYGFYIGGNTPHVWTDQEIAQLKARYALPIFVCTNPAGPADGDAAVILSWLHAHRWTLGTCVAVDTESVTMPAYVDELNIKITNAGYLLVEYESKGAVGGNPPTSGGRWIADWTNVPHMHPSAVITQYADAHMAGTPWDCDVVLSELPLHELHPPAVHKIATATFTADVPVLSGGDHGPAVTRVQALLLAWHPRALDPTQADGVYGPVTTEAVRSFQRAYGITAGRGTVTAETWQRLIEG